MMNIRYVITAYKSKNDRLPVVREEASSQKKAEGIANGLLKENKHVFISRYIQEGDQGFIQQWCRKY